MFKTLLANQIRSNKSGDLDRRDLYNICEYLNTAFHQGHHVRSIFSLRLRIQVLMQQGDLDVDGIRPWTRKENDLLISAMIRSGVFISLTWDKQRLLCGGGSGVGIRTSNNSAPPKPSEQNVSNLISAGSLSITTSPLLFTRPRVPWRTIAAEVGTRTANQCRLHWSLNRHKPDLIHHILRRLEKYNPRSSSLDSLDWILNIPKSYLSYIRSNIHDWSIDELASMTFALQSFPSQTSIDWEGLANHVGSKDLHQCRRLYERCGRYLTFDLKACDKQIDSTYSVSAPLDKLSEYDLIRLNWFFRPFPQLDHVNLLISCIEHLDCRPTSTWCHLDRKKWQNIDLFSHFRILKRLDRCVILSLAQVLKQKLDNNTLAPQLPPPDLASIHHLASRSSIWSSSKILSLLHQIAPYIAEQKSIPWKQFEKKVGRTRGQCYKLFYRHRETLLPITQRLLESSQKAIKIEKRSIRREWTTEEMGRLRHVVLAERKAWDSSLDVGPGKRKFWDVVREKMRGERSVEAYCTKWRRMNRDSYY
jgi:hypothetical protein